MKSIVTLIATGGLLIALAASANADSSVYVIAGGLNGAGQFGTVNLTTGAFQQLGPIEPDGYFGLAPGPNGSLLSLTYAGNLDSINPATGVPTRIGATGLGSCVIPSPLCSPTSAFSLGAFAGEIYATDFQNNLYVVNSLTGEATLLSGHTGLPPSPFILGSQNADGTLNFADEAIWEAGGKLYITYDAVIFNPVTFAETVVVAPKLYQIDPVSGHATVIGPTDVGIGGGVSVNGTSYVFDDLTNQISTIDLSTGTTSPAGFFDFSAGVIQGAVAAPVYLYPVLISGNNCNGTYTGAFHGDVNVANGQACVLLGGSVTGSVTQNGGSLSISNAVVGGNVKVQGGGVFSIGPAAEIGGNVQIQNIPFGMTLNHVCETRVKGNLDFQNNGAPVQIGSASLSCLGNAIGGDLDVDNNTGLASTAIIDNTVGGNLHDQNNAAPSQVSGNQVTQNLQCQNNSMITGNENTATRKQGQCAAF